MKNYNDLDSRGKFIRSCVCVPICWAIIAALWIWLPTHFTLGMRLIIELVVVSVICVPLGIWQLVSTYKAYMNDKNGY